MAEEIKIVVKQETQGDALQKAKKETEELQKAQSAAGRSAPVIHDFATASGTKGNATRLTPANRGNGGRASLATSLPDMNAEVLTTQEMADRKERLEREAAQAKRDAIALEKRTARESASAAKQLAKEAAQAQAENVKQARKSFAEKERIENAGGGAGGGGGSSGGSMLGGLGGIRGLGHIVTAALAFGKRIFDDQLERSRREGEMGQHGIEATNRTGRIADMAGVRGEEEATGDFHAKRAEIEGLKDKRGSFGGIDGGYWDQFKHGLKEKVGMKSWFGMAPMETDSERGERENEEKIHQGQAALDLAKKNAEQKFEKGTGRMELDAQKARTAGHMQEARAIDYKIIAAKTYNSLLEKTGSDKIASEGAQAAVAERAKQDAGSMSKLVTARDGVADTARVAGEAQSIISRANAAGADEIKALHYTVQQQHEDAKNHMTRTNFFRPSRR